MTYSVSKVEFFSLSAVKFVALDRVALYFNAPRDYRIGIFTDIAERHVEQLAVKAGAVLYDLSHSVCEFRVGKGGEQ